MSGYNDKASGRQNEIECEYCGGSGKTSVHHNTGLDSSGHFWASTDCPVCKGAGKVDAYSALERKNKQLQRHCKFIIDLGEKSSCDMTRKAVSFWKQINASMLERMFPKPVKAGCWEEGIVSHEYTKKDGSELRSSCS